MFNHAEIILSSIKVVVSYYIPRFFINQQH